MSGKPSRSSQTPVDSFISHRFIQHTGQSTTSISTVSSPTVTTPSIETFSSLARVVSPVQDRPPSVRLSDPSQPGQPAWRTKARTTLVTPPPSRVLPVSPPMIASRSLPSHLTHAKPLPSTWIEAESDSDDEDIASTQPPTMGCDMLPPTDDSVDRTPEPAAVHAPNTLPPILAQITPDESRLPRNGMCLTLPIIRKCRDPFFPEFWSIRASILANPYYLGEPCHIYLRNSKGDTSNRKMKSPRQGISPADKWYAISSGTRVGIFLSW